MKLENIYEEFPKMPDDMRKMVEDEVARQLKMDLVCENIKRENAMEAAVTEIKTDSKNTQRNYSEKISQNRFGRKKFITIIAAAALALGTTAFAGSSVYKLYKEKIGSYGVGINIQVGEKGDTYSQIPKELEKVEIVNHYIPEGMIQPETDPGKMFFEETPYQGGFSMVWVTMDTKVTKDDAMMVDRDVKMSEVLEISGHEAVYLEKNGWDTDHVWFDKKMYIIYPEIWRILEVYGGSDISKDEMLKVVENTELKPTGELYQVKDAVTWSEWVTPETEEQKQDELRNVVKAEEIADIYEIGEEFELLYLFDENLENEGDVYAKVTEVQVVDDLSLLGDSPYVEESWKQEIGEDGKLKQNEIQYIRRGDGIDSKDKLIKTEFVNQKLLYITVEYTNKGDKMLENMLYSFHLEGFYEDDGKYILYDRKNSGTIKEWDEINYKGEASCGEIGFYDLHSGERDNNYIPCIKPGETITIHFAEIVNEDEMKYMYLNLGSFGSGLEFTTEALKQGYVDIRQ